MPVNIKVIHTRDFIKTTVTGVLDFVLSKQALLDIASEIERPGEYEMLVDTREAETTLSTADIFELGEALAAHLSLRRSKIALLIPMRDTKKAEFFETIVANRGLRLRTFTDFEVAINWLVMHEAL